MHTAVNSNLQAKIVNLLGGTIDPTRESVRIRDNTIRDTITTGLNRPAIVNWCSVVVSLSARSDLAFDSSLTVDVLVAQGLETGCIDLGGRSYDLGLIDIATVRVPRVPSKSWQSPLILKRG